MDLYFSPLASSLASRIALYEAGGSARFIEVDARTKCTLDGGNYLEVYPLGLVPALRLDEGSLLTENAAILSYIAGRYPAAKLAPADDIGHARLQQWLCFIATELHQGLFCSLFDEAAPPGTRAHILAKYQSRLKYLNDHLDDRDYLLDHFTVADAYLYTVLNWSVPTRVDLGRFPAIKSYQRRQRSRPSIEKAFQEELALYKAELARHQAA